MAQGTGQAPSAPGAIRAGTPSDFGICRSCGCRVAWVRDRANRAVALEPEPHRMGSIVVLANGIHMIDLDEPWVPDTEVKAIKGTVAHLFLRHWPACGARGMRHAGWAAAAFVGGRPVDDPARERRRAANLAADRARDRGHRRQDL